MDETVKPSDFKVGQSVKISPSHWLFLAGAHAGEVVKIGRTKVHVRATINGVTYAVTPRCLTVVSS